MGQANLKRTQFVACEPVTVGANDDRQELAFTGYFSLNDTVDVVEMDGLGNILSTLASALTINSIEADEAMVLSAVIDTTTPPNGGTYKICVRDIDDGQEAIDRLYRRKIDGGNVSCDIELPLSGQQLDAPIVGQATYDVDDVKLIQAGDTGFIVADEGLVQANLTVVSASINADDSNNKSELVLDDDVDLSAFTNPKFVSDSVTIEDCIRRVEQRVDAIDEPCEGEDLTGISGNPNGSKVAYEMANLYLQGSSKIFLDGIRKKKGTCGTRSVLSNDAADAELILTSMILNTDGDKTDLILTDPAGASSPLSITVTGDYNSGYTVDVSLETDGGSAIISTAQEVADAINAHADAKLVMQAQYGGDGSGVQSALVSTNLAGGADDATGDYCEIEQVFENSIANTGYKFISFNVRPNEKNRMNVPPCQDEDLCADYRKALVNA